MGMITVTFCITHELFFIARMDRQKGNGISCHVVAVSDLWLLATVVSARSASTVHVSAKVECLQNPW